MMSAKTCPATREQLLRGILWAADSTLPDDRRAAINEKTRLCELVHEDDILYFFPASLRLVLQCEFTSEQWAQWLGLGDGVSLSDRACFKLWLTRYRRREIALSVGDLVDFLAPRTEVIAFETVTLLGRPCEPAGVMLGLERLRGEVAPDLLAVAPSSTIASSFNDPTLTWFWTRMRVVLGDRVPQLPMAAEVVAVTFPRAKLQPAERIAGPLTLLCIPVIVILAFLACWKTATVAEAIWEPLIFLCIGSTMLVMITASWLLYEGLCHLFGYVPQSKLPAEQPLPQGIDTFRDLATWIVQHPPTGGIAC